MKKLHLQKKFRCNICNFVTNDIGILETHVDELHNCFICSKVFFLKAFHSCLSSSSTIVGHGRSVIREPADDDGKPFFKKESQSFFETIASYSYTFAETYILIRDALDSIQQPLFELVNSYVKYHTSIKIKIVADLLMHDNKTGSDIIKRYPSAAFRIGSEAFTPEAIENAITYIESLVTILAHNISG